jgi:hypothetical protein
MKVVATYACGHDATRPFDTRNMAKKWQAEEWKNKAIGRDCPKCNNARIQQKLAGMDADTMRQILTSLLLEMETVAKAIDAHN